MSDASEKISAFVFLADYIASEQASGKLNIIGGNVSLIGFNTQAGVTTPFFVGVILRGDHSLNGEEFTFEISLVDDTGEPVSLPGPVEPQVMRIGQNMQFRANPEFAKKGLPVEENVVVGFDTGLPLRPGETYAWKVRIDGNHDDDWKVVFHIPSGTQMPVVG